MSARRPAGQIGARISWRFFRPSCGSKFEPLKRRCGIRYPTFLGQIAAALPTLSALAPNFAPLVEKTDPRIECQFRGS